MAEYIYTDRTGEEYSCSDCAYNGKPWYEEPCDSCCRAHSGFQRAEETNEEPGED